jgi:hypothetical protein
VDTNVTRSRVDGISGQFKLTLDTLLEAEGGELEAHTQVDKILTGRVAAPQDTSNTTAAKSKLYTVIRWLSPIIVKLGNKVPKYILKQALTKAIKDFGYKISSTVKGLVGWVCEWLGAYWIKAPSELLAAMEHADRTCRTIDEYWDSMEAKGFMSSAGDWVGEAWMTLDLFRMGYLMRRRDLLKLVE